MNTLSSDIVFFDQRAYRNTWIGYNVIYFTKENQRHRLNDIQADTSSLTSRRLSPTRCYLQSVQFRTAALLDR